jgi:glyoxylase-like metal-dependent hydrolase (beta-lactamase superfamily II)
MRGRETGHTPGQSYYVLESEGQKMIFWGDIIHVPDIQFTNPNVTIKFDVDSTAAAARRKKDFADAAKNRTLVAMPHMFFPGVGHVAKDSDHYRWIPLPYVNDAKPAVKETKQLDEKGGPTMPMIDVYAAADLFPAGADRQLGEELTLATPERTFTGCRRPRSIPRRQTRPALFECKC